MCFFLFQKKKYGSDWHIWLKRVNWCDRLYQLNVHLVSFSHINECFLYINKIFMLRIYFLLLSFHRFISFSSKFKWCNHRHRNHKNFSFYDSFHSSPSSRLSSCSYSNESFYIPSHTCKFSFLLALFHIKNFINFFHF